MCDKCHIMSGLWIAMSQFSLINNSIIVTSIITWKQLNMYINNVCVFYIAKVQLSFTIMVGGDFVVGFVCSCKHKLQLNINCNDHLQMIYIYIYILL
jgi:hypothetical protein